MLAWIGAVVFMEEPLAKHMSGYDNNIESKTSIMETLQKHISRMERRHLFIMRNPHEENRMEEIVDAKRMLPLAKGGEVFVYGAPILNDYEPKGIGVIFQGQRLGERYGQKIFTKQSFRAAKSQRIAMTR